MVKPPVRVFAPNYVAHLVAIIKESRLKNLLVKSCTVEADVEGNLNVLNHCLLTRSGVDSVGIESLVENKTLKNGLAVDEEFLTVELYVTQTEIAVDLILIEAKLKVIKSAFADLPKIRFFKVKVSCYKPPSVSTLAAPMILS